LNEQQKPVDRFEVHHHHLRAATVRLHRLEVGGRRRGIALLVVLDTLSPAERLAFVLHDLFAVHFEEVARIADRSPAAARQLASRARRRVAGAVIVAAARQADGAPALAAEIRSPSAVAQVSPAAP